MKSLLPLSVSLTFVFGGAAALPFQWQHPAALVGGAFVAGLLAFGWREYAREKYPVSVPGHVARPSHPSHRARTRPPRSLRRAA